MPRLHLDAVRLALVPCRLAPVRAVYVLADTSFNLPVPPTTCYYGRLSPSGKDAGSLYPAACCWRLAFRHWRNHCRGGTHLRHAAYTAFSAFYMRNACYRIHASPRYLAALRFLFIKRYAWQAYLPALYYKAPCPIYAHDAALYAHPHLRLNVFSCYLPAGGDCLPATARAISPRRTLPLPTSTHLVPRFH